jgi:uncharacterized spore protein YtfJ
MSEEANKARAMAVKNQEQLVELVEKLFEVAQPGAVFGEPITVEGQTVITASEVSAGGFVGYALGSGSGTACQEEKESEDECQVDGDEVSFGGGAGVGGGSMGRPVAAITIGPEGVKVEPIVDGTKIALAFFTTIGSMFMMLLRMRKASQG